MNLVHPNIFKKLKNITYETCDNFIFYGPNGSGKYTLFKLLIEHIFKKKIITKKETLNLNKKTIDILISSHHYEIFLDYKKFDKIILIQLLEYLTQSKAINQDYKIIFFRNAHFLSIEMMSFIKNSIETKGGYIKYMFTTNNINKIKYSSLFINIRVPLPLKETIINIIGPQYTNMIQEQKCNLTRIMFLIKYNKTSFKSSQLKNKLIKYIKSGNINNIETIRSLIYEMISKNYNKTKFIKELFDSIYPKTPDIIEKTITISNNIINSYKDTIHIEYYCIYLLIYYNKLQQ